MTAPHDPLSGPDGTSWSAPPPRPPSSVPSPSAPPPFAPPRPAPPPSWSPGSPEGAGLDVPAGPQLDPPGPPRSATHGGATDGVGTDGGTTDGAATDGAATDGGGQGRQDIALRIFAVAIVAAIGAWSLFLLSQSLDGYRATHGGVSGTVVVTRVSVSSGGGEGGRSVDVRGDFTASGGRTRRGVRVVTGELLRTGYVMDVVASRTDPGRVYPPGSRDWIGNAIFGSVLAVIDLSLMVVAAFGVAAGRRRRRARRAA